MSVRDSESRKSFLVSVPTGGDHVDRIHKTQEEWNGAGTFWLSCDIKEA